MMNNQTNIHFAPIQGHTDSALRTLHATMYHPATAYYTPFIRWEKDGIRSRDLRDIDSEANRNTHLVAQIIFRNREELESLAAELIGLGCKELDLNMGCPFPLQTARGRGAALAGNPEAARWVAELTNKYPETIFSVKMRPGLKEVDEWKASIKILNTARLNHITIHPRVAAIQYGGEPDMEQFKEFIKISEHPTIYNGDLRTPKQIAEFREQYPEITSVMIGRGLLARPSLTSEIAEGEEWPREKRIEQLLKYHRRLLQHYSDILCGDNQILSKIKPFWEYSEEEIGRKVWKSIRKSVNMAKYRSAVAMIE